MPNEYPWIAADGMSQQHCLLPWLENIPRFPKYLPLQHYLQARRRKASKNVSQHILEDLQYY